MSRKTRKRSSHKRAPPNTKSSLLLDQFSQRDLRTWKRVSEGFEKYHIGVFYHLEGLRQLHQQEICNALLSSTAVTIESEAWIRIVDYQYSLEPLSLVGSILQGGRFNLGSDLNPSKFPVFPALYVAGDFETAYREKFGGDSQGSGQFSGHEFALRDPNSFTAVRLNVQVSNLFDLKAASSLKDFIKIIQKFDLPAELKDLARKLGISPPWLLSTPKNLCESFLAPDWRAWPTQFGIPSNPQVFGQILVDAGFDGVLYPSSKGTGACAAIFPQNFQGSDSCIQLMDESPAGIRYPVLDESTFDGLLH